MASTQGLVQTDARIDMDLGNMKTKWFKMCLCMVVKKNSVYVICILSNVFNTTRCSYIGNDAIVGYLKDR